MKKYAIIVAGGSGARMNSDVPKQFMLLNGNPVLFQTLLLFHRYDSSLQIILVLPEKHITYWEKLCKKEKFNIPHQIAVGGEKRFYSVKNGLKYVKEKSIVAIHDGVRPLVKIDTIKNCFAVAEKKGNAIPVIPVNDSLRQKSKTGNIAVNRNNFLIVQTPQCFDSGILKRAYEQRFSDEFTDDAAVVEKSGQKINLVKGNAENIKITSLMDLIICDTLMDWF